MLLQFAHGLHLLHQVIRIPLAHPDEDGILPVSHLLCGRSRDKPEQGGQGIGGPDRSLYLKEDLCLPLTRSVCSYDRYKTFRNFSSKESHERAENPQKAPFLALRELFLERKCAWGWRGSLPLLAVLLWVSYLPSELPFSISNMKQEASHSQSCCED